MLIQNNPNTNKYKTKRASSWRGKKSVSGKLGKKEFNQSIKEDEVARIISSNVLHSLIETQTTNNTKTFSYTNFRALALSLAIKSLYGSGVVLKENINNLYKKLGCDRRNFKTLLGVAMDLGFIRKDESGDIVSCRLWKPNEKCLCVRFPAGMTDINEIKKILERIFISNLVDRASCVKDLMILTRNPSSVKEYKSVNGRFKTLIGLFNDCNSSKKTSKALSSLKISAFIHGELGTIGYRKLSELTGFSLSKIYRIMQSCIKDGFLKQKKYRNKLIKEAKNPTAETVRTYRAYGIPCFIKNNQLYKGTACDYKLGDKYVIKYKPLIVDGKAILVSKQEHYDKADKALADHFNKSIHSIGVDDPELSEEIIMDRMEGDQRQAEERRKGLIQKIRSIVFSDKYSESIKRDILKKMDLAVCSVYDSLYHGLKAKVIELVPDIRDGIMITYKSFGAYGPVPRGCEKSNKKFSPTPSNSIPR